MTKQAEPIPNQSHRAKSESSLSTLTCIGWGLGTLGTATLFNVVSTLFLKHVVDTVGLAAGLAATLIAVTRVFDAISDPLMGVLSDRTHSRFGRRRPYLLIGGPLCAVSVIFLFSIPMGLEPLWTATYVFLALVFYTIGFTVFNVPYLAMPVEMTASAKERTVLISFRVYAFSLGALVGGALAPFLVTYFGGGHAGFQAMSMTLAVIILISCTATFVLTAKAPYSEVDKSSSWSHGKQLRFAFGNKPFRVLLGAKLLILLSVSLSNAGLSFLITTVQGLSVSWIGYYFLATTAGLLASQSFWVWLSGKLGKRRTAQIAILSYSVAMATFLLATSAEPVFWMMARGAFVGIGAGGTLLCTQAMLPDVLDLEVKRSGQRYEGKLTGFFSTIERLAGAVGIAAGGYIISAGGYIPGEMAAQQPHSAILSIYLCAALAPAACLVVSAVILSRYSLEDEREDSGISLES